MKSIEIYEKPTVIEERLTVADLQPGEWGRFGYGSEFDGDLVFRIKVDRYNEEHYVILPSQQLFSSESLDGGFLKQPLDEKIKAGSKFLIEL